MTFLETATEESKDKQTYIRTGLLYILQRHGPTTNFDIFSYVFILQNGGSL